MKVWLWFIFIIVGFNSCKLTDQNGSFTDSSIQTIDMGKLNGLRIIEIASLNYPEPTHSTQTSRVFTEIDKQNFSDSLIQSLKRSDVRVLPSAQTKIHIDFTLLVLIEQSKGTIMTMTADVAVSRNGIITRKTIDVNSKTKLTISVTKDDGMKLFIQELGNLLREQSTFKR